MISGCESERLMFFLKKPSEWSLSRLPTLTMKKLLEYSIAAPAISFISCQSRTYRMHVQHYICTFLQDPVCRASPRGDQADLNLSTEHKGLEKFNCMRTENLQCCSSFILQAWWYVKNNEAKMNGFKAWQLWTAKIWKHTLNKTDKTADVLNSATLHYYSNTF